LASRIGEVSQSERIGGAVSDRAKRVATVGVSVIFSLLAVSCSPKVGSESWCKKMDEKAKGDWTANEAASYAKNCIFK
jgi:hypothetical protein